MKWPLGSQLCKYQTAFRGFVAFSAWMALGFVAISRYVHGAWASILVICLTWKFLHTVSYFWLWFRCVSLAMPRLSKILFKGKRSFVIVFGIWIYGALLILPSLLDVYGSYGYNPRIGKCDFLSVKSQVKPHIVFYVIGFSLPCASILISYFIIWKTTWKSSVYLKRTR